MKISNTEVYGLEKSIIASGYPMRTQIGLQNEMYTDARYLKACKLGKMPGGHNNFLKGIIVQFDLTYPQYFTPQLQRYNFIDIVSSQSKMHTLTKNEDISDNCNKYVWPKLIEEINNFIYLYNENCIPFKKQELFMEIISNLPMGYELTMAVSTNYLQLLNIYKQRKNHRLEEWKVFTDWIETLSNFKELTGI